MTDTTQKESWEADFDNQWFGDWDTADHGHPRQIDSDVVKKFIRSLLSQNNQVWIERMEQIIGQDETEYRDSRGVLHAPSSWQKIRNALRAEQRHRAKALATKLHEENR